MASRPDSHPDSPPAPEPDDAPDSSPDTPPTAPVEIGGRAGPEPTRFGDWERNGIAVDF